MKNYRKFLKGDKRTSRDDAMLIAVISVLLYMLLGGLWVLCSILGLNATCSGILIVYAVVGVVVSTVFVCKHKIWTEIEHGLSTTGRVILMVLILCAFTITWPVVVVDCIFSE